MKILIEEISFEIKKMKLYGDIFSPYEKGKYPAILFFHGFTGRKEEMWGIPAKLAKEGFITLQFDFRGHGKSEGERGYVDGERLKEDAQTALKLLKSKENVDIERIGVLGHSLGATVAMMLLSENEEVRCGILCAPPGVLKKDVSKITVKLYSFAYKITRPLERLTYHHIYIPYLNDPSGVYENPASAREIKDILPRWDKLSIRSYKYLFEEMDNIRLASTIDKPVLVLIAEKDRVISNEQSIQVFKALKGEKTLKKYPSSGHCLLGDYDHNTIYEDIKNWLINKIGKS